MCEEDVRDVDDLGTARTVIGMLLDGRRPSRVTRAEQIRHLALWRMMNVLLELSEDTPEGVVFPYPNPHAAAGGVVVGFKQARLHSRLTVDVVLQVYKRHYGSFHAP